MLQIVGIRKFLPNHEFSDVLVVMRSAQESMFEKRNILFFPIPNFAFV